MLTLLQQVDGLFTQAEAEFLEKKRAELDELRMTLTSEYQTTLTEQREKWNQEKERELEKNLEQKVTLLTPDPFSRYITLI